MVEGTVEEKMMFVLEKYEKADPMYGMEIEYITDEMIEALKNGKRIYIDVMNEYAVVIKYKKGKKNESICNNKRCIF